MPLDLTSNIKLHILFMWCPYLIFTCQNRSPVGSATPGTEGSSPSIPKCVASMFFWLSVPYAAHYVAVFLTALFSSLPLQVSFVGSQYWDNCKNDPDKTNWQHIFKNNNNNNKKQWSFYKAVIYLKTHTHMHTQTTIALLCNIITSRFATYYSDSWGCLFMIIHNKSMPFSTRWFIEALHCTFLWVYGISWFGGSLKYNFKCSTQWTCSLCYTRSGILFNMVLYQLWLGYCTFCRCCGRWNTEGTTPSLNLTVWPVLSKSASLKCWLHNLSQLFGVHLSLLTATIHFPLLMVSFGNL